MSSSSINHLSQSCIYGGLSRAFFFFIYREEVKVQVMAKLFKGGSNRGTSTTSGPPPPQFLGDKNIVWRAPVRSLDDRRRANKEKEELDRAIALSLAEDLKRPQGYRWQTDNDEDIARSLHDGLTPPEKVCGGCHREIGTGNYLGCKGTFFHPDCFRCHACGCLITEFEVSFWGGNEYHKSCFKEMTHPKCDVCHQLHGALVVNVWSHGM